MLEIDGCSKIITLLKMTYHSLIIKSSIIIYNSNIFSTLFNKPVVVMTGFITTKKEL